MIFFYVVFFNYFLLTSCQQIGTDVKTNFCGKYSYISRVELTRTNENNNNYDIAVECQKYVPNAASLLEDDEQCELRSPFPLEGYTLLWQDYLRNCRCNEYLGGIQHYYAGWDGKQTTNNGPKLKIIQLQCCWSSNKEQVPPSCVYSGMEYLHSPWATASMGVIQSEMPSGSNFAIQGFVMRGGYMNARICDYRVANNKGYLSTGVKSGIRGCWSGVDWDCTENGDQDGICYDDQSSMWGWRLPLIYDKNYAVASLKAPGDDRQIFVCRNGYRLSSLEKTIVSGTNGKSYKFSMKCAPMASRTCYCVWLPKCPAGDFFGTLNSWYVAGIRTLWDVTGKNTKLEVLCCNSASIKTTTCQSEVYQSENLQIFYLNDKSATFPLQSQTTIKVVTNIESFYDNGILNMRYNVCSALYTYGWCYNDPCYWCRTRAYRDGVQVGGSGYWSSQDSGSSSSSLSSSQSVSSSSQADAAYWNSWSGWSSWSGSWGNCGGRPVNIFWLGNLWRGSWASWNTWHRSYDGYDDDHYSTCSSCSSSTVRGRWTKSYRTSNGGVVSGGNPWKFGGNSHAYHKGSQSHEHGKGGNFGNVNKNNDVVHQETKNSKGRSDSHVHEQKSHEQGGAHKNSGGGGEVHHNRGGSAGSNGGGNGGGGQSHVNEHRTTGSNQHAHEEHGAGGGGGGESHHGWWGHNGGNTGGGVSHGGSGGSANRGGGGWWGGHNGGNPGGGLHTGTGGAVHTGGTGGGVHVGGGGHG